jgi:hypothetical protein
MTINLTCTYADPHGIFHRTADARKDTVCTDDTKTAIERAGIGFSSDFCLCEQLLEAILLKWFFPDIIRY